MKKDIIQIFNCLPAIKMMGFGKQETFVTWFVTSKLAVIIPTD